MRSVTFTCDGCDTTAVTPELLPETWHAATSGVYEHYKHVLSPVPQQAPPVPTAMPIPYDLCADCFDRLKTLSNPRNWSRVGSPSVVSDEDTISVRDMDARFFLRNKSSERPSYVRANDMIVYTPGPLITTSMTNRDRAADIDWKGVYQFKLPAATQWNFWFCDDENAWQAIKGFFAVVYLDETERVHKRDSREIQVQRSFIYMPWLTFTAIYDGGSVAHAC